MITLVWCDMEKNITIVGSGSDSVRAFSELSRLSVLGIIIIMIK